MPEATILAFVLVIVAIVFFGAIIALSSRLKKVGPNQVLIISGRGETAADTHTGEKTRRRYRIVTGGAAFIWPVLERVDTLSLELMTIEVRTEDVYTVKGVPVTVDGVAQIKIGSDDVSIATAAERFLSKSQQEILHVAHETMAGHLRAMLGHADRGRDLSRAGQVCPTGTGDLWTRYGQYGIDDRLLCHQEYPGRTGLPGCAGQATHGRGQA